MTTESPRRRWLQFRLRTLLIAILRNTAADDAALTHIANLYYLEDLDLSKTQVTDAGLQQLTSLQHLHRVQLENTQVTPEGVNNFQAALPNCRIKF